MRKAKIWIEEQYRYEREIDVLVPDEMTDGELEELFNECERYNAENASDVARYLGRKGIQLVGQVDDDMDCPDSMNVEITEYEFAEEDEKSA